MYSESRQDEFVMHMMNGKIGEYLEIGAAFPIESNNTYLLEQNGWNGLSLEIDPKYKQLWDSERKNKLVIADALQYEFEEKEHIEYLQLDIEPPSQTFKILQNLLELKTKYSIITFETDAYIDSSYVKPSRDLLTSKGYTLAVPDVQCKGGPFEDWYINPEFVDIELLKTWKINL
jgi:hypothetical protein